jgi:hypothetical protein
MAAAGRDGTPLYEIHHPFSTAPDVALAKLAIGRIDDDFYHKSPFYAELVKRMRAKGFTSRASIRDDAAMMFKFALCITAWISMYYLGWCRGYWLGCIGFGLSLSFIGMLVMHGMPYIHFPPPPAGTLSTMQLSFDVMVQWIDGNHQGTNVKVFNRIAGEMMTLIGGCAQQWTFTHVIHHQAPNQDNDPDTFQVTIHCHLITDIQHFNERSID